MAAIATVRVEIRDLKRTRQLVWELRQIEDRLRIGASPEAENLEHALDRFLVDLAGDEPEGERQ